MTSRRSDTGHAAPGRRRLPALRAIEDAPAWARSPWVLHGYRVAPWSRRHVSHCPTATTGMTHTQPERSRSSSRTMHTSIVGHGAAVAVAVRRAPPPPRTGTDQLVCVPWAGQAALSCLLPGNNEFLNVHTHVRPQRHAVSAAAQCQWQRAHATVLHARRDPVSASASAADQCWHQHPRISLAGSAPFQTSPKHCLPCRVTVSRPARPPFAAARRARVQRSVRVS